MTQHLLILALAFVQNVSFSLVARSRNRDHVGYHICAAVFSNTVWFLTFKQLIAADMTLEILPTYTVGTVVGSVFGVKISMVIERWVDARSDSHLKA